MLGPLRICCHPLNKNLEWWSHESVHHPAIFEYLGPSHYYKINFWWGIEWILPCFAKSVIDTKWLYHTEFDWKEVPMPLAIGSISHSYSRQHCNLAFGISWTSINIDNKTSGQKWQWHTCAIRHPTSGESSLWFPNLLFFFNGYLRPIGDDSQTKKPF